MFAEVMEKVLTLFTEGYAVYIGPYYGDPLEASIGDIVDAFDDAEGDEWFLSVDDTTHEVHVFTISKP